MQNFKALLLLFTFLMISLTASAQTTYYYKLTKKKVNGEVSENVSGGQFITLVKNGDVCYESDKEGFSVNHGRMEYKSTDENGIRLYVGDNYYGSNSILLFKSDYSSFNIKVGNDVYVYKRATPPSGVTTCSLIRKPVENNSSASTSINFPSVSSTYFQQTPQQQSSFSQSAPSASSLFTPRGYATGIQIMPNGSVTSVSYPVEVNTNTGTPYAVINGSHYQLNRCSETTCNGVSVSHYSYRCIVTSGSNIMYYLYVNL